MYDKQHEFIDERDEAEQRQARLTAYALDQLDETERREVEQELAKSEDDRRFVDQTRRLQESIRDLRVSDELPSSCSAIRATVETRVTELEKVVPRKSKSGLSGARTMFSPFSAAVALLLAASAAAFIFLGDNDWEWKSFSSNKTVADADGVNNDVEGWPSSEVEFAESGPVFGLGEGQGRGDRPDEDFESADYEMQKSGPMFSRASTMERTAEIDQAYSDANAVTSKSPHPGAGNNPGELFEMSGEAAEYEDYVNDELPRLHLISPYGGAAPTTPQSASQGQSPTNPAGGYYPSPYELAGQPTYETWSENYQDEYREMRNAQAAGTAYAGGYGESRFRGRRPPQTGKSPYINRFGDVDRNEVSSFGRSSGEQYDPIHENRFLAVSKQPLSTFSIDVDTASYANVRRFLDNSQLPPPSAVRIEELVNYFQYNDPAPKNELPFAVRLEMAECPWRPENKLLRVGLKGKEVHREERPASNLVFLLDVSGSMADENKLPLLKSAMKMLTAELGENDRVAIVTYAGEAGLRLDSTRGDKGRKIQGAIDALSAGGSTNGSAGIELAYEKATENFIKGGVNRVILATDGDLNVGVTDDDALVDLIKRQAKSGVFLTVLGFGTGNLKDSKLEKLADNGNGSYAYIDGLREARRVLVEQISGSLVTIAKDVKIQIEFNPAEVAAYRLIGYENRLLAAPDFDNDKKDAGEIGAGHSITALYEIVPTGVSDQTTADRPPLKYQQSQQPRQPTNQQLTAAAESGEMLTLFLRYKQPDADESNLLEFALSNSNARFGQASDDFRFAAAVASFGMLLRGSAYRGDSTLAAVEEIASAAIGSDPQGYRTEFVDLVRKAAALK